MHRCARAFSTALATLAACTSVAVSAQQLPRNFPANALRGEIVVSQPPEVLLNGKPARLAPGSRIRGENNMLALSNSLIGSRLVVNYTFDDLGLVKDVWVLREDEAAKKPWPRTPEEASKLVFDSLSQTWSRP